MIDTNTENWVNRDKALTNKIDLLEKKLAIAMEALRTYANAKPTEWYSSSVADNALKEMDKVR